MNAIVSLKPAHVIVGFPLNDDVEDRLYTFVPGTNLADALMRISPDRWGGLTFELYCGAVSLDSYVHPSEAPNHFLKSGEVWHVAVYPAEPVSTTAIVGALATYLGGSTLAYVAATVIVYTAITAISMAISFALSMLLAPGKQADKSPAPADQPTSLNGLAPPRNMMRPLSRIPDIYGRLRNWPDLIFPAWSRWEMYINPDPAAGEGRESTIDRATQYVQAVYCLGRGYYDVTDFRFGDSPVSSANGSVTIYPPGSTLPPSVKHSYEVKTISRLELNPDQANPWSPWYEIGADSIDEIWFQISFPGGVNYAISGKKVYPPKTFAINGITISIQGERLDENGAVVETLNFSTGFQAITRNELRQTYGVNVTPGRWRVRIAQTNPNNAFWRDVTFQGNKKTYLEGIVGFRSLSVEERTFPHETIIIVNANTLSAPAIQNMDAFNVIATRRLPTQVVGAPPGTLSGLTADRRWITAAIHTLTDPYICNYAPSEIDWASLVEVQASLESYTDPYDEGEFNGIFDRQMSADEQLQAIAKKARAIAFMSHGRITFARDQRRTGVSAIFNRRNRMAERGNIGLGLRLPGPDEHDGVEITWFNEFDDYRQETYTYPEGITPLNPLSIDLIGATKPWEVCRRARFEYAAQLYRRRSQPLRVTEEAQLLLPYDRVGIVAPWDEGVIDGEVIEIDGTNLRLDRPIPLGISGGARIRLRSPDGRQTSLHSLTTLPERGPEWLALDGTPSFSVVVPGDDRQMGTLYNLSQDDNYDAATHWLVTGAEIDDRGVTLTLMEDADEVYQLSDDLIDPCQGCTPGLVVVTEPTEFVPVWAPDPINWPNDIISPIFGNNWESSGQHLFGHSGTGLFTTNTGTLVAAVVHWDWVDGTAIKFEGKPTHYLWHDFDDFVTGGYDGIEAFNMSDGTVCVITDAALWRFSADGDYILGPVYGPGSGVTLNVTYGACAGTNSDEFFTFSNPPNQFVLRKWEITAGAGASNVAGIALLAGPVVVVPLEQLGGIGGGIDGAMARSGNTLAIVTERYLPDGPDVDYPLTISFYSTSDLSQIGSTINVSDVNSASAHLHAIKPRDGGGFAVLFSDQRLIGSGYWGSNEGDPSGLFLRIRFFEEDGSPSGPSIPFYQHEAIGWWHYSYLPKVQTQDFAMSSDNKYVLLAQSHQSENTDEYVNSNAKVALYDIESGSAVLVETVDADVNVFYPPEQERPLSVRITAIEDDQFIIAFSRYTDSTAYAQGGRTPIYRRTFAINRCEAAPPPGGCTISSVPIHIDAPAVLYPLGLDGGPNYWVNVSYGSMIENINDGVPSGKTATVSNPSPGTTEITLSQSGSSGSAAVVFVDTGAPVSLTSNLNTGFNLSGTANLSFDPGTPAFRAIASFNVLSGNPVIQMADYVDESIEYPVLGGIGEQFIYVIWEWDGTTLNMFRSDDQVNPLPDTTWYLYGSYTPADGETLEFLPFFEFQVDFLSSAPGSVTLVISECQMTAICGE